MKSFEEYSKSVYEKRDRILRQRKKRIKAAVTVSLCAAIIVPAAYYVSSEQSAEKSNAYFDSAASQVTDEYKYLLEFASDVSGNESADEQRIEMPTEPADSCTEIAAESGSAPEEAIPAVTFYNDNAVYDSSDGATPDIYHVTEADTPLKGETKPEDFDNYQKPEYSQEEIINAAYEALTEDEKSSVRKDEVMVNIEHHSSGEENYLVMFPKEDGGFIKIKLDAVTLEIRS